MLSAGAIMLVVAFALLLVMGAPIAVALGLAGAAVIAYQDLGIASLPTNVWTGIAKYPLLALPVFITAGMVFERSGVAERLVRFMSALIGQRAGGLGLVAILVSVILGGISGSGAADAAAVATVLLPSMLKQGYPRPFCASLIAASGSTAILIPPSIAFIIYAVIVPGVSVPALFIGGIVPGLLAGAALMVPTLWLARRHGWGASAEGEPRPPLWQSFKDAAWGLAAPVVILGGLRSGAFTPTEAAVVAVAYGLFVGVFVYRTLNLRRIFEALRDSAEISAVVLTIVGLATVFAHAGRHRRRLRRLRAVADGTDEERDRDAAAHHAAAAGGGHAAGRDLDLPDLHPHPDAHRAGLWLGPDLVRHPRHDEPGDRLVHAADGGEPDGHLPHRRLHDRVDHALGAVDGRGDGRRHDAGGLRARTRALPAACHGGAVGKRPSTWSCAMRRQAA